MDGVRLGLACVNVLSSFFQVFVSKGDEVTKGTILMTVEGMKMEVQVP